METPGRLIVDLARLDEDGEWYRGETSPEVLELGASEWLTPQGGIVYALFVQALGTELLVRGEVRQRLACVCARCADSFETEAVEPEFVASFEIPGEEAFMDLTEAVREAIILTLPSYPVCRDACRGLCQACGANLNRTACTCRREGRDSCWSALDVLE